MTSAARAFLAVVLVALMAGSAVALAVGGNFSPQKTVCIHPIAGSSYEICVHTTRHNVKHLRIRGFNRRNLEHGHLNLRLTNRNKFAVTIKLVLRVKTKSGKIRRITRTFVLEPGQTFRLHRHLRGIRIRAARLKLTISDANGDRGTITRSFGRIRR